MKNRKATIIESTLLILAAIGGGWYVGSMATDNISQEPQETVHRLLIIDFVKTNQPLEV